jgi:NADH:ubiquinone oxidoreductase subunit H
VWEKFKLSTFIEKMFLDFLLNLGNSVKISLYTNILTTIFSILVPILLIVAFTTLFERQVMASMQRRMGPQTSGLGGLLQPFYDG